MIKIDVDTRCWKIPKEECFLGVESDDKVKILQFELSKNEFCNGLNFTDCNCFINYKNNGNDTISYGITDMEVQEDGTVTFTWEVSRRATIFKGDTFAILCAKKVRDDGTITNEWNSRIGSFIVSKGLEPSSSIVEVPEIDIISQLLLVAKQTNANAQTNIEQSNSLLEKAEGIEAELIDGRIGYDGTVYDNIGGAIRGQVSKLKGDLADLENDIVTKIYTPTVHQGALSKSGTNGNYTITVNDSSEECYCDLFDLSFNDEFTIHIKNGYRIYGWILNKGATFEHFGSSKNIVTSWTSGETDVIVEKDDVYTGIALRIRKTSGTITPTEALNAIEISYKEKSIFETKSDSLSKVEVLEQKIETKSRKAIPSKGQVLYNADTRGLSDSHIVNAVSYDDGVIIACRANGTVVRIVQDGTETTIKTFDGATKTDFRCMYMDSNENVYASPHASMDLSLDANDRGLYKLVKGENTMTKVISLYNPSSSVVTETQDNDDTIWTMCEDEKGYLYAGVYAHTKHNNPTIYKSSDGGNTWNVLINFNDVGLTNGGKHIHSIIYDRYKKALYCIVGEINTIFKSTDHGETWTDLHIELTVKGSAMIATKYGIFIGSDGAYNCDIDVLYPDDKTHKKVFRMWANTVFAIRESDETGFLYAFTKIDSSVKSQSYFPPNTVLSATTEEAKWEIINTWKSQVGTTVYDAWKEYYDSVKDIYPNDAIIPTHYAILISRDGGDTWEVLKKFTSDGKNAFGFWTTGYFKNGECLTGRYHSWEFVNPIVISEGKHKYVNGGCDMSGEIFAKTNTNTVTELI